MSKLSAALSILGLLASANLTHAAPVLAEEAEWRSGPIEGTLAEAERRSAPVLIYFWADSSQQCANIWADSLTHAVAQPELAAFVCHSARIGSADTTALVQRFNVTSLPTLLILTSGGAPDDAMIGYHGPSLLVSDLQRIRAGNGTVSDLREQADAAPDDLALRFNLAAKLDHVGAKAESQALYDSITRDDPRGKTEVAARLLLWDAQKSVADAADDPNDPTTFDLKPMYKHLRRIGPKVVAFEGWTWVIPIERARGEERKLLRAMRSAWEAAPQDRRVRWGVGTAWELWQGRATNDREAKAFALELAVACVDERDEVLAEGGEEEEYDLAPLDVLACCQLMNGRAAEALATLDKSVERNGASAEREQLRGLIAGDEGS